MPDLGGGGTGEQRQYGGTKNIRKHVHFIQGYIGQASLLQEKWGTGKPTSITTELEQCSHRGLVAVDGGTT